MSRQINQPINQVKLTNVAVVRYQKMGKRFEVACYRNKVVNYRQGIETDLEEVLQTERVFTNVSKGEFANKADLQQVFGSTNQEEIIELILQKGDLQISDLERQEQYEAMGRDIATWISEHGVHPTTNRPYTVAQIRQGMKQCEYNIHPTHSMKKQYLDCFKKIKNVLTIVRAKMKIQLVYTKERQGDVTKVLEEHSISAETTAVAKEDEMTLELLVDPSLYRPLEEFCQKIDGRLQVLKQVVMREGDVDLNQEVRENQLSQQQYDDAALTREVSGKLAIGNSQVVKTALANDPIGNTVAEDDDYVKAASQRQSQKKAQKKSKKAKRREKEQAEERQARIDTETTRRETRAAARAEDGALEASASSNSGATGTNKPCNTCGGMFANMTEYRAHFRSDWHRYNVKLKMQNVTPVSEEEFLLVDADAFFDY